MAIAQFEGQITYGTRCLKCGTESERSSSFLELEISLSVSPLPAFRHRQRTQVKAFPYRKPASLRIASSIRSRRNALRVTTSKLAFAQLTHGQIG